jgi:crossover junction endodeoxyribonuclease RuvC
VSPRAPRYPGKPKARARKAPPLPVLIPGPPADVVIGLDPGSVRTGWGIVRRDGQQLRGVAAGIVKVREKDPLHMRLRAIHEGVCEVIAKHAPQAAAVESIFFSRYPQVALGLGHARGVALLALAQADLPVASYPPSVVKRAVTGRGRADKRQVALIVGAILGWNELPGEDATDALAVAITHMNASRFAELA